MGANSNKPSWMLIGGGAGLSRGHLKFGESLAAIEEQTSAVQTGTGANQEISHYLGRVPDKYMFVTQGVADYPGPFTVTFVSMDAEKIVVNATAGLKFQVVLGSK